MVVASLKQKSVFIDTAPLIYFIEGHSQYQAPLKELFIFADSGQLTFITSTITLIEVLVKPYMAGRTDVAAQYQQLLLNSPGIDLYDVNSTIATKSAELRAEYQLKTPDAIQLATAIENNADYFLTNDIRLKKVTTIKVLVLDDLLL